MKTPGFCNKKRRRAMVEARQMNVLFDLERQMMGRKIGKKYGGGKVVKGTFFEVAK